MKPVFLQAATLSALALAITGCSGARVAEGVASAPAELAPVVMSKPQERDPSQLQILFWSDDERSARFQDMESWFAGHEVPAASNPRTLEKGAPLDAELAQDIRDLMLKTNAAGVMVYHKGAVRFEDYALGFTPQQRWTSFSVAKSFTSTLLGAAIADGFIGGLEDPVTLYIPALKGSAYEGVTVGQLATMTSGVAWNEDYTDPESDVAQMNRFVVEYGPDAIVEQMKSLERAVPAGSQFVYKTGETNLIGMLVENAIGLPLAEYAQRKIVEPAGFEGGLFWMTDPRGGNIGGCCLSLTLADYTRMGVFVLEGGKTQSGEALFDEGWFAAAGAPQVEFGDSGFGYGYQWWTYPGEAFGAQGIFGQSITIDPSSDLVLTVVGNWPRATSSEYRAAWRDIAERIAD